MSFFESIGVALFVWALVFVVLFTLCAMVIFLTKILGIRKNTKTVTANNVSSVSDDGVENALDVVQASSGELKLKNVDEKTAAMIMAIVSDETKIPLSELCFKSISAID